MGINSNFKCNKLSSQAGEHMPQYMLVNSAPFPFSSETGKEINQTLRFSNVSKKITTQYIYNLLKSR